MDISGRRLVIAAVAVIALIAGGFAWAVLRTTSSKGPLVAVQRSADGGAAKGVGAISIGAITFGNYGKKAAVITSITPVSPSPGLNVEIRVLATTHPSLGEQQGIYHHHGLNKANGFVVPPSQAGAEPVEVVAILHANTHRTHRYTVRGLTVHYHVGDHNYVLFIDEGMAVCYTFPYKPSPCQASIPAPPS
jgi:hypothetical protein